jgi:predicted transcriptional regulator
LEVLGVARLKRRKNGSITTVVVSLRMPLPFKERLDELAAKGLTTRNAWMLRTLIREANWREAQDANTGTPEVKG